MEHVWGSDTLQGNDASGSEELSGRGPVPPSDGTRCPEERTRVMKAPPCPLSPEAAQAVRGSDGYPLDSARAGSWLAASRAGPHAPHTATRERNDVQTKTHSIAGGEISGITSWSRPKKTSPKKRPTTVPQARRLRDRRMTSALILAGVALTAIRRPISAAERSTDTRITARTAATTTNRAIAASARSACLSHERRAQDTLRTAATVLSGPEAIADGMRAARRPTSAAEEELGRTINVARAGGTWSAER